MSGYEITCANRDTRGGIVRIGGEGWSLSVHEAIVKLVSQQLRLNIYVDGRLYDVGVRGDGADAYLAVEPDGFPLHSLAGLQSC
jgi:hypothetical protein